MVWWQESLRRTVVARLPRQQRVGLIVDNHIFIFYGQRNGIYIDGEEPVVTTHMLHLQIARRVPAAQSRMVTDDGYRLSLLQLRSRHAEKHRLAVEGDAQRLHLLFLRHKGRRAIGLAVEMIL